MQFPYNDGLKSAGRTPKLWIVHRGQIQRFSGVPITGLVAVLSTSYEKGGKWSNTTYQLELVEGATACYLLAPMHGQVWPENNRMAAYRRFMKEFGVTLSFEAFDAALVRDYPKSRGRMIEGEKALESLDTAQIGEADLVEISTSKSCNRNPHDDVRVTAPDGRSWIIAHEAPVGMEIPSVCKLTDKKHTPGYNGGMTTLVFAIAKNVKVDGEYYPKDGIADSSALGRDGDVAEPKVEVVPEQPALTPEQEAQAKTESLNDLMTKFGTRK